MGKGTHNEGKRRRDTAGPMDAKLFVHLSGTERNGGAKETPEGRIGHQDGSGVQCGGVDEVVHDAQKDENHTEAERCGGNNAHNPVSKRIRYVDDLPTNNS